MSQNPPPRKLEALKEAALEYHRRAPAGKLAIIPTKPMETQRDLSLAYSPGVAAACLEIKRKPITAGELTAKRNLVAVISNGTAVLGLGSIGALAAKPVMEGKAVLFKKFADVDVFDLEVDETDPQKLIDIISALEPSFGGINLEDIKAPECFAIEQALIKKMKIPVFHDDQHGTAIIVSAAVLNALELVEKDIATIALTVLGAGASATACIDLLVSLGLDHKRLVMCDSQGVIYSGRKDLPEHKRRFATDSSVRTLEQALVGCDVFLGLSVGGALAPQYLAPMAARPIVMALANPDPEVLPEEVKKIKPDAIVATGRSDYPNQVNNVLCFPFLFRGALDVGATEINLAMKIACVHALADLAKQPVPDLVSHAYGGKVLDFGPDYVIPKPLDTRLIVALAPAVARAAMETGCATYPIADFAEYRRSLLQFTTRSGLVMRPIMDQACSDPRRLVFAEGEEPSVLQAVARIVTEHIARPILIGRRAVVESRIARYKLNLKIGESVELCDPESDPRYRSYWQMYHQLLERQGVTQDRAKTVVRTQNTVIASLMVLRGEAEALICGVVNSFRSNLQHVEQVIGRKPGLSHMMAMTLLVTPHANLFLADTHIGAKRRAEDFVELCLLAATEVRRFGLEPRVALVSSSNFGSHNSADSLEMRRAVALLHEHHSDLEVDGEMHVDCALDESIRSRIFPSSKLTGSANLLIFPDLNSGHAVFNALKVVADGIAIGPMLRGVALPAHIVMNSIDVEGLINTAAVAVVDAQQRRSHEVID